MATNTPLDINTNEVIRDKKGRWIKAPKSPVPITTDNAREMQALAVARKRAVMAAASNREVQDETLFELFGDYAAVAERAITLQRIATTPEAGKAAVLAHKELTLDTGLAEKQVEQGPQSVTNNVLVLDDTARSMITRLLAQSVDASVDIIPSSTNDEQAQDTEQAGTDEADE